MNEDYKRGYSKGYYKGIQGQWPEHRPPEPPSEKVRALVIAARELRDVADCICAVIQEDDDIALKLAPKIDALDAVMMDWAEWLKSND